MEVQSEAIPHDAPAQMVNGDHNPNSEAFGENAALPKTDTSVNVNVNTTSDVNLGGPTPVEDVAPGIAPIADFIPKDAPTSHPTPPPDEPLGVSEANVDTEMTTDSEVPQAEPEPEAEAKTDSEPAAPLMPSTESSLVRPREEDDDDDDEPSAKRSRFEGDSNQEADVADVPPVDATLAAPVAESSDPSPAPVIATSDDVPMDSQADIAPTNEGAANEDAVMESQPSEAPVASVEPSQPSVEKPVESNVMPTESEAKPVEPVEPVLKPAEPQDVPQDAPKPEGEQSAPPQAPAQTSAPAPISAARAAEKSYSTEPMTAAQHRFLVEKMKNLKKTKNSSFFLNPVDPVALGIPSYPEIIKNPMDLNTMERKLKDKTYQAVQDFANDFHLIIGNTRTFNGDNHAVTQAGFSMKAYFDKMMESVPSANQPAPAKPQPKKASPKPPSQAARRESRSANVAAPAAMKTETSGGPFALQADGVPQIRRDSTKADRPARAIKPPPARDLAYAKPKRKEHQLELKFCDWMLNELSGPRYGSLNTVFQAPVDPVALNIPHYRQVVKHPMDLSTMRQKLKQGQYGKATEVKKDFDLMIQNCLLFNPAGNPVRDMGIQFQREMEALWKGKDKWEKNHKAESNRGTSVSADEDSGEEEEEDDEEEDPAAAVGGANQTIAALQKQLAGMQKALASMGGEAQPKKQKKSGKPAGKSANKKSGSVAAAPKQKASTKPKAAKKVKQVTYEEKQEISEAVGKMDGEQVEQLTKIITDNVKKYADQEEMELEIDDLPNDVQAMLLTYVRKLFGNPNRGRAASPDDMAAMDDDDFEPERGGRRAGGGGEKKRKKHKPMGKQDQLNAIASLEDRLQAFKNPNGANTSQSPAEQADTSGDDESEESEEE